MRWSVLEEGCGSQILAYDRLHAFLPQVPWILLSKFRISILPCPLISHLVALALVQILLPVLATVTEVCTDVLNIPRLFSDDGNPKRSGGSSGQYT